MNDSEIQAAVEVDAGSGGVMVAGELVGWVSPWNLDLPDGDWYARRRMESAKRVPDRHDALLHVLGGCPDGDGCENGCGEER